MSDRAHIQSLALPPGRRVLVMSDIHGNLPYFEGLLAQVGFSDRDFLILDGDLLEKGMQSLALLRRVMTMSRKGNVFSVCGNCDGWARIFDHSRDAEDRHFLAYVQYKQSGLIWEMCRELGVDPLAVADFTPLKWRLFDAFPEEIAFLAALPDAIESEHYVFAHAGMTPGKPLREHRREELNRIDRFLDRDMRFDKWLIVGHYPVVLYGEDTVCANPIVDRNKRVVSIDGGCVLKDDGQLNALILPERPEGEFRFEAYDPFPERTVLRDQAEGLRSYYIRWGDCTVRVLARGAEFSRCRHVRTGYEMDILTKYLFADRVITDCSDCTDYILPLKVGDRVRVVEETSRGYFVKHHGTSGWYFGELGD